MLCTLHRDVVHSRDDAGHSHRNVAHRMPCIVRASDAVAGIGCGPLCTMASTPGPVVRIAVRARTVGAVARSRVRTGARTVGAAVGMVRAPTVLWCASWRAARFWAARDGSAARARNKRSPHITHPLDLGPPDFPNAHRPARERSTRVPSPGAAPGAAVGAEDLARPCVRPSAAGKDETAARENIEGNRVHSHPVQGPFTDLALVADDDDGVKGQLHGCRHVPARPPVRETGVGADQPESPAPRIDRGGQHLPFVVLPRQQCVRTQCPPSSRRSPRGRRNATPP
ncbi:hypothetical protein HNQ79_006371 [Streptomyces candidus]|uniref:Uncharacterized protein n=1 Tax=Streptomyces candidus TaxID=67283 RepID=A0A7X0LTX7_9ACTN|nr:hypothetical protein [Streptomyces candidus]